MLDRLLCVGFLCEKMDSENLADLAAQKKKDELNFFHNLTSRIKLNRKSTIPFSSSFHSNNPSEQEASEIGETAIKPVVSCHADSWRRAFSLRSD